MEQMPLAARLRFAREAAGIRQAEAADLLAISESGVSEMESGKREPKACQLAALAKLYKRSLDFFFEAGPLASEIVLWRGKPDDDREEKKIKREFLRFCEDYRRLEELTNNTTSPCLTKEVGQKEAYWYSHAEELAARFWRSMDLGSVPATTLLLVLEERCGVKTFALTLRSLASSASTWHERFGPAVLLNQNNVRWRRNFDLAHELFHLLTWTVFRSGDEESSTEAEEKEEKLANCFASRLLLPEEPFLKRIKGFIGKEGGFNCTADDIHEVAREFDVSADAVVYRVAGLLRWKSQVVEEIVLKVRNSDHTWRENTEVPQYSHRYIDLVVRCYKEGLISFNKGADFLRMTHREAEEILEPPGDAVDSNTSITVNHN